MRDLVRLRSDRDQAYRAWMDAVDAYEAQCARISEDQPDPKGGYLVKGVFINGTEVVTGTFTPTPGENWMALGQNQFVNPDINSNQYFSKWEKLVPVPYSAFDHLKGMLATVETMEDAVDAAVEFINMFEEEPRND